MGEAKGRPKLHDLPLNLHRGIHVVCGILLEAIERPMSHEAMERPNFVAVPVPIMPMRRRKTRASKLSTVTSKIILKEGPRFVTIYSWIQREYDYHQQLTQWHCLFENSPKESHLF